MSGHRAQLLAFVSALACASAPPCVADAAAARTSAEIGALQAAETFAYAWASRDAGLGIATTDFGRSEGSPGLAEIRGFFVGLSSPHHAAFAIERMMRVSGGGYACTLTLYEYLYSGHGRGGYDATTLTIELEKVKGVWKVVAVPGLYGFDMSRRGSKAR